MADPSTSTPPRAKSPPDWKQVLSRSLRLRCPHCGQGEVCRGWFHLHRECGHCGYDYQREPGFYLGSIYLNYGLTALLLTLVCGPLVLVVDSLTLVTLVASGFCVLFPIWFLRYARSLWLGFDYFWDRTRARPAHRQEDDKRPGKGGAPNVENPDVEDVENEESWKRPVEWTPQEAAEEVAPEKLSMACPYCHETVDFEPDRRGDWQLCPHCDQKILLLPLNQ